MTNDKSIKEIATALGLKTDKFHETDIEDVRLHLFFRRSFDASEGSSEWSQVVVTPFASIYGVIGAADKRDLCHLFSLSAGNNGHHGIGFDAGISLDFHDTIEATIAYGATFFNTQEFCNMPIPDDECQSGIFPCKTKVCVDPGHNWHFAGTFSVYNLIDKLSFFLQYAIVSHDEDKICVKSTAANADKFKPEVLTPFTKWNARMINAGFNYDLNPNISIGFLVQIPTDRRNGLRTTTYMGSFVATI